MSDDPRRTGFCTPECYRECQCSRWPDMLDRWGNPVNHGSSTTPVVYPWWNPLGDITCIWAAYQPVGAASFANSLLDISGNGNNAIDPGGGGTPGWNAVNGWIFDGNTDYLMTTFTADLNQTQSCFLQFTNLTFSGNDCLFGLFEAGASAFMQDQDGSGKFGYYHTQTARTVGIGAVPAAGNAGIAGNRGYQNGVIDSAALLAGAGASVVTLYIGASNVGGVLWGTAKLYIRALAIYSCTLTAPQITALVAAMAAL